MSIFLSKACPQQFSRSGTPKIDDFWPFFKNKCPKFLLTQKKRVFRVADFFEKSRKLFFWGGGVCNNTKTGKIKNYDSRTIGLFNRSTNINTQMLKLYKKSTNQKAKSQTKRIKGQILEIIFLHSAMSSLTLRNFLRFKK